MRKVIHSVTAVCAPREARPRAPGRGRRTAASGQRGDPPGRRGGGGGWRRRPTDTDPTIPDFRCTSDAFQISHKNRAIIAQESRTTPPSTHRGKPCQPKKI
jgi:hypothetical protein